jgi:antitoxin VapB
VNCIWDGQEMAEATLFTNNKSQAVRIPKALEFPEGVKKVRVIPMGNARLITPAEMSWDSWFDDENVTADFMNEREQPADQEREAF